MKRLLVIPGLITTRAAPGQAPQYKDKPRLYDDGTGDEAFENFARGMGLLR